MRTQKYPKSWRTRRRPTGDHLVRIETREHTTTPVHTIPGHSPPIISGSPGYHTTPSGKTVVRHPGAYGHSTLYHPSTVQVAVGEGWRTKLSSQLDTPPGGCVWDRDYLGVKLVALSDGLDWHLSPGDIAGGRYMAGVKRGLASKRKEARTKRQDAQAREYYLADSAATRVSLADSLAAGNCPEGALRFAELKLGLSRHGVLKRKHSLTVPAARLRARANGQGREVEKAIARAYERETLVQI